MQPKYMMQQCLRWWKPACWWFGCVTSQHSIGCRIPEVFIRLGFVERWMRNHGRSCVELAALCSGPWWIWSACSSSSSSTGLDNNLLWCLVVVGNLCNSFVWIFILFVKQEKKWGCLKWTLTSYVLCFRVAFSDNNLLVMLYVILASD